MLIYEIKMNPSYCQYLLNSYSSAFSQYLRFGIEKECQQLIWDILFDRRETIQNFILTSKE